MKVNFDEGYLQRLATIEIPSLLDSGLEGDYQILYDYAKLRNSAEDLLRNPKDDKAEKKLCGLILKLNVGIID